MVKRVKERLKQDQLAQVVAEVEQLARSREAELDEEQVKEILRELNLPDDLLEEAMLQLQRREALVKAKQRSRWIGVGAALLLVGAIATTAFFLQHHQQQLTNISASQSRITLSQDNGGQVTTIDRSTSPQVYYRVTLQEAPLGEKLSLKCDWIDPQGQVVHQNSYQTREIDREVWPTSCRYQLGSAAPSGTWQVQMSLGEQVLSSNSFTVEK